MARRRIAVVGNCQAAVVADGLRQMMPDADFIVQAYGGITDEAAAVRIWSETIAGCNLIVSQEHDGDQLGPFRRENIAGGNIPIIFFPAIMFTGFHPDLVAVPHGERALPSPIRVFHSRIAAGAYLANIPLDRATRLYNAFVFDRLGYFDEFERAKRYLLDYAASLHYDLSVAFDRWAETGPFMHIPNHPAGRVMLTIARLVCRKIGEGDPQQAIGSDPFARHVRFPVFREIARRVGVKHEEQRYVDAEPTRNINLTATEFVAASFAIYARHPRHVLQNSLIDNRLIDVIRRSVVQGNNLSTSVLRSIEQTADILRAIVR